MKERPSDFESVFTALQRDLARTKMHAASAVADAQRIRAHVRRCRAARAGEPYSLDHEATFIKGRSAQVH